MGRVPCEQGGRLIDAAVFLAATILGPVNLEPAKRIYTAGQLPADQQPFARCVAARESGGRPDARNPNSTAQGKYQWLDRSWRHGLAHMTAWRLRDHGMRHRDALRLRQWLRDHPIAEWPEPLQDVAFAASLNARGKWSGWRHWYLAGSKCNRLAA